MKDNRGNIKNEKTFRGDGFLFPGSSDKINTRITWEEEEMGEEWPVILSPKQVRAMKKDFQ